MRLLDIIAALIITLLIVMQHAYADFSFHNQFSYIDETKIMHILGEIRNDSDSAMKNVRITISFYDSEGNLLDEYQRAPALQVINPGESSPFEILLLDSDTVERVANFTMTAQGQNTELKEKQLEIISSNSRLDILGTYYINAAARNNGQERADNAIMIATLYDKDGRVIAIGHALAEAGRGSSNITAGSEAPFGIVITDKLQTYKTARYSLVVDSDQYMSERVVLQASSPGLSQNNSSDNNQNQSGCLIATAAFGSELAPAVQQLRLFRDEIALKTFAGSSFMNVFNAWYYSFSPTIAEYERQNSWLQSTVKVLIYPLLGILTISTHVYDAITFNDELGIVVAGITASLLIGLVYLAPLGAAIGISARRNNRWTMSTASVVIAFAWVLSMVTIVVAQVTSAEVIMMTGASLLVLIAISTAVIAIARMVVKS
ncbi:MAG TPA: CFI-box-CTERM domain-containing protein [Nitrososphaera sp.]|nr:CFI-box-CTERM domain-containing protein [Nitrososphaera sp.]